MIGRRVDTGYYGAGVVVKWEPLGASMTDVLIRHDDGREIWHGSRCCRSIDGLGPLPDRQAAQDAADREALAALAVIRAQHVADFGKRWPGLEHGKAIVGRSIDGAIADVRARLDARAARRSPLPST